MYSRTHEKHTSGTLGLHASPLASVSPARRRRHRCTSRAWLSVPHQLYDSSARTLVRRPVRLVSKACARACPPIAAWRSNEGLDALAVAEAASPAINILLAMFARLVSLRVELIALAQLQ